MPLWNRRTTGASREAGVVFVKTEHNAKGGTFHVHRGPSRAVALTFLRQNTPEEELVYTIVETPEGNVGCDFIYLFEESDGKPIEFVPRPSSKSPKRSTTHCAWCGFVVVPYEMDLPTGTGSVELYWTLDEVAELGTTGRGLVCNECSLLHCIPCSGLDPNGSNTAMPKCRACVGTLGVYSQGELKFLLATARH